ncbi:glycogenin-1a isoform X1 [Callorhinchus milii]|uniref:glycogenin glucosyltransferase n=2 Tax=Callorhinchus milii TaxID=7868 RepID=V9KU66_CALMI|nr:glycogenin-1a isoform X1 [Callorhinchus milii]|eukprot:gi/632968649/ref/XP_007900641.1/ PREDICTED: glycogenin-1 isoform X1 [Callorhinchus milii]
MGSEHQPCSVVHTFYYSSFDLSFTFFSSCFVDQAFVTLATNDLYGKGALVLGCSLRNHKTSRQLVILITPHVSNNMRAALGRIFDEVLIVNVMDSQDSAHLNLIKRPELGITFTKLHCWALTRYSRCVFMDADTMVLANIDELFEREELSAAPDPGWPDCFNTGVFVYRPSIETYNALLQCAMEKGSFDGGDQGLLNSFFGNWATSDIKKHLPFIYNLSSIAVYSYLPAFKQYGANAKVIHFLGSVKPWNYSYDPNTKAVKRQGPESSIVHPEFLNMWWDTFTASVLPLLAEYGIEHKSQTSSSIREEQAAEAISQLSISSSDAPPVSSEERRQRWEQGQMDFMGADSFQNIQKKLDVYLN